MPSLGIYAEPDSFYWIGQTRYYIDSTDILITLPRLSGFLMVNNSKSLFDSISDYIYVSTESILLVSPSLLTSFFVTVT